MSHSSPTLSKLRTLHPRFVYEEWSWELEKKDEAQSNLVLTFEFILENSQEKVHFSPKIIIENVSANQISAVPAKMFENFIFHLGLMEIPSYWKAACSPEIVIHAGFLSEEQIAWWNELLLKGLGEFFYTNSIDFTQENFVSWSTPQAHLFDDTGDPYPFILHPKNQTGPDFLVPVGGGKDSALTVGFLEKNQFEYASFLLEPHSPAAKTIIEKSHPAQVITAQRVLDPELLKLNALGYLNGHTPFSAVLAFVSSFAGLLFGIKNIVLSNERSANEGNLQFHGTTVNHQYSKTFEFEKSFQAYLEKWVYGQKESIDFSASNPQPHTQYFSLLRPLYEIQIARLFSEYPQYFPLFRSCNVGQKENVWCHACPKCLFVFVMLFPFLDSEILTKEIFNHNLFEDASLLPLLLELMGETKHKPLECVGTYEEVKVALFLSVKKYKEMNRPLPILLEKITPSIENISEIQAKALLDSWNGEHALPKNLEVILKKSLD